MSELRDGVAGVLDGLVVEGGPSMELIVALDPGKKTGRVEVGVSIVDGAVSSVSDDLVDEPAVVVALKPALIDELVAGELDIPVAYMRGDAKLDGEPGPVLDALRWFDAVLPAD